MDSTSTSFGQWLRKTRKAQGITQEELASQIGCAFETIRKIEAGSRRPSRQMAELIARKLGIAERDLPEFAAWARADSNRQHAPAPIEHNDQGTGTSPHLTPHPSRFTSSGIPSPPTPFIGRQDEVQAVCHLLEGERTRLVTLLGPPGIGKTRLAIEVARTCKQDFEHGTFFAEMASISTHELFIPTLAAAIGIKGRGGPDGVSDPHRIIYDHLCGRRALLVLDNMEHILPEAANEVIDLLDACPHLRILATSREPLHIYGEREYDVPPLTNAQVDPDPDAKSPNLARPPSYYEQYEAVQLFLQRAHDVDPNLTLTENHASYIARICHQLDDLPLAIELAAAQCKVLTPKVLLARLSKKLALLTRGANDLPDRQQTLFGAIDWSYKLLTERERKLFRRLSVFKGGASLEAIEAICALPGEQGSDLLNSISALVDKSLLRRETDDEGEPRFYMLLTIGEYAAGRLNESDEAATIRERHAAYYTALAEHAESALTSARRETWLSILDAELYNLRAAMRWALQSDTDNQASARPIQALQVAGALHWFWFLRGRSIEGRDWLEKSLAAAHNQNTYEHNNTKPILARALDAAGRLALMQSDFDSVLPLLEQGVALWRDIGDKRGLAYALTNLGVAIVYLGRQDGSAGTALIEEAAAIFKDLKDNWGLAFALDFMGDAIALLGGSDERVARHKLQSLNLYRDLEDSWGIASLLSDLGYTALRQDDFNRARQYLEEALEVARIVGDKRYIAFAVGGLAEVTWHMGNLVETHKLFTESLELHRELGERLGEATALRNLGLLAHTEGKVYEASKLFRQSLKIAQEVGNKQNLALMLGAAAGLIGAVGKTREAARLLGASDTLRESSGGLLPPTDRIQRTYTYETLRSLLGDSSLEEEMANGKATPLERSLQLVESGLLSIYTD